MNFQSINAAKKDAPGAYLDSVSTPTAPVTGAINYIDGALGRRLAALKSNKLDNSTAIIVTAKHGETALDPTHRSVILTSVIPGIVNSVNPALLSKKPVTQKSNAFIWLSDQSQTDAVVHALTMPTNQFLAGIGQVLSGESLELLFPDPLTDPATPDIIVVANTGVNYEPTLTSTTLAEHGGFGENDTHVPLIGVAPHRNPATILAAGFTTQIAPTILAPLKLKPGYPEAVQPEYTDKLPFIP